MRYGFGNALKRGGHGHLRALQVGCFAGRDQTYPERVGIF